MTLAPLTHTQYVAFARDGDPQWEELKDPRFQSGTLLGLLHEVRYRWMLNTLLPLQRDDRPLQIVSLGCVPGVCERILKAWWKERISILGIGLGIDDAFCKHAVWFDALYSVDLDPAFHEGKVEDLIPLASSSIDAILAGEILEHLVDPRLLWTEAKRLLRKGGHFILTTPNVSYAGNIARLVLGKTCLQSLDEYFTSLNTSWRPHYRIYSAEELRRLAADVGMVMLKIDYLNNHEERYYSSPIIRWKCWLLGLIGVFPRYRNTLVGIFQA